MQSQWLPQLATAWLWDLMQRRWHEGYLREKKFVSSTTWHWMSCNTNWSNQKSNFGLPSTRQTLIYQSDPSRELSSWSTGQSTWCAGRGWEQGLGLFTLQKALAASGCCLKPCNSKVYIRETNSFQWSAEVVKSVYLKVFKTQLHTTLSNVLTEAALSRGLDLVFSRRPF